MNRIWFKRLILLAVGFSAAVGVFAIRHEYPFSPDDGTYVGSTESEIVRKWGRATAEWDGHYGNPPLSYVKKFGPAKTLTFERWTGTLYISLHEVNGDWV